jgi:hypothetical protein
MLVVGRLSWRWVEMREMMIEQSSVLSLEHCLLKYPYKNRSKTSRGVGRGRAWCRNKLSSREAQAERALGVGRRLYCPASMPSHMSHAQSRVPRAIHTYWRDGHSAACVANGKCVRARARSAAVGCTHTHHCGCGTLPLPNKAEQGLFTLPLLRTDARSARTLPPPCN